MSTPKKLRPTPEEVLAANQVLAAARAAEEADKVAENRQYVGRFFRYHNSYGPDAKWWMYFAVTGIQSYGGCTGWSIQRTTEHEVQVALKARAYITNGGYSEITPAHFWREAGKLIAQASAPFNKPTAKRSSRSPKAAKSQKSGAK